MAAQPAAAAVWLRPWPVSAPDPRSAGHMAGYVPQRIAPPDPDRWRECRDYLRGLDLFNYGYYWEAHEVWEGLWHAVGRGGLLGDFFKGLIKLSAAGVKARERRAEGTIRHARRATELLGLTAARLSHAPSGTGDLRLMGLSPDKLAEMAAIVAQSPPRLAQTPLLPPVEVVFDFQLIPA